MDSENSFFFFFEIESDSGINKFDLFSVISSGTTVKRLQTDNIKISQPATVMMESIIEDPNLLLKLTNEVNYVLSLPPTIKKLSEKFYISVTKPSKPVLEYYFANFVISHIES